MKISRSTGYALLAAGYIARNQKQGIILSQAISKKYNIPLEYLLKILQQLVKANLLRSKRGPRGGFSLGKPAKKITLLQVIEAVDGPMVSKLYLAEHARGEKFAARIEQTYDKAIAQARAVFAKVKLGDILGG
ncbi:MAG: RrF2 family transcriptional regulator [Planctomycetota bacterium]|jgi:Rrf2 family protein